MNAEKPEKTEQTVSFTFLGTNHHRLTHHSILTGMFEQIHKHLGEFARLFDGVGCEQNKTNPTPGTYEYNRQDNEKIPNKTPLLWRGKLLGYGTEDLVHEAIRYIERIALENNSIIPTTINLQGFSRGADTCVRLANEIYRRYPTMKVNLFLIDQVPGSFRRDVHDSYTIPLNVVSFNAVIMLNETSQFLKPQHLGRWVFESPATTQVSIHTLAGAHGQGITQWSNLTSHASYFLVQDALLKFNIANKSLPDHARIINDYLRNPITQIFTTQQGSRTCLTQEQRFAYCCASMQEFKQLNQLPVAYRRTPTLNRSDYVATPEIFINQEHRELFKELYPDIFNWFFEKNSTQVQQSEVRSKLTLGLLVEDVNIRLFFQSFCQHFTADQDQDKLEPQGLDCKDPKKLNQPLERDLLTRLQHQLQSIINYYKYHYSGIKNRQLDKQVKDIHLALNHAALDPKSAIKLLNACIVSMNQNPHKGFITDRVSQIVLDGSLVYNILEPKVIAESSVKLLGIKYKMQQYQKNNAGLLVRNDQQDTYRKKQTIIRALKIINSTDLPGQKIDQLQQLIQDQKTAEPNVLKHRSVFRPIQEYFKHETQSIKLINSAIEELNQIKSANNVSPIL